jgi:hypothetical protein
MITEDFVSFNVAKLLKEKGFDELCIFKYSSEGVRMKAGVAIDEWQNSELDDDECSCVSHQMAMAWLREVHGIDVVIEISDPSVKDRKYYCMIWDGNNNSYILDLFNSYEECVEAGIKYCLENLVNEPKVSPTNKKKRPLCEEKAS